MDTRACAAGIVLLLCCGCLAGRPPTAHRIRPDTNDRYYPGREIHFVEHGQRSRGVLVAATRGFDNPFSAGWVTMLVPADALEALAAGDAARLGTVEKVFLNEDFASENQRSQAKRADRERLDSQ
jgi:hypothetical protein